MCTDNKGKDPQMAFCYVCGHDAFGRKLVTIKEAAEFCKVSIGTIYQWMDRGQIEWVLNAGGKRRIFKDSLITHPRRAVPLEKDTEETDTVEKDGGEKDGGEKEPIEERMEEEDSIQQQMEEEDPEAA